MTLFPHERPVQVTGVGDITVPTRDSRRAARFYSRVFGFRIVSTAGPRVRMRGPGCLCLTIDEHRHAIAISRRLTFMASDLDSVRERLWDLGVALADGCIEPRFDAGRRCRCLPFRDPDGNEIELVERAARRVAASDARLEGRLPFACLC